MSIKSVKRTTKVSDIRNTSPSVSHKLFSIFSFLPPFIKKYVLNILWAMDMGNKYSAPVSVVSTKEDKWNVRINEKRFLSLLIFEYGSKNAFFSVIWIAKPPLYVAMYPPRILKKPNR